MILSEKPSNRLLAVLVSALLEKILQEVTAFAFEYPAGYIQPVIEPAIGNNIVKTAARSGLWVATAENKAIHPCKDQGTGTHGARFEGNINSTAAQPPTLEIVGCLGQCDDLSVRGGVVELLPLIVGLGDDPAFVNNDGPDGHIAIFLGDHSLIDRPTHKRFVNFNIGHQLDLPSAKKPNENRNLT